MNYHHGGSYFQCSITDVAFFCWYYFQYHSQYYDYGFSGHNQDYNQSDTSRVTIYSALLKTAPSLRMELAFSNGYIEAKRRSFSWRHGILY
eukprot:CAMPEP_0201689860 /NCGR_PEP_ID=MMETSP0578-20130828/3397_1 /ASSEMBLY_ACC=CAM_ASM_000663 /TAXON_ID=267565 /ORGANISM="Skeletonema grethea, Strain CCMP 1804" /LENGTH=90 /DNA_ID=CAMNT_0048174645 /DNA_START=457 /DNA_END=729 /DNA_ORIENTATION=+